ncbi:N-acetyltransferase [Clostridia bacterium]|nr:N-acetyltransferase [Clostridia bacterium]
MKMNIALREWKRSDAADLVAAINNKKVLDNLRDGIPFPYSLADAEDFIGTMLGTEKDSQWAFAITLDDKAIGSIGAFRQANIHSRTAEMGYYIAEPYWGQGVATAAIKMLCEYVFENTDIIRIFAEPFAYNAASCRVLEKAGFQFEGTLRKNAVKNGNIVDMKMYSNLKGIEG